MSNRFFQGIVYQLKESIDRTVGVVDENDNFVYLNAEDYLKSPMPFVDETDEDEVADEMRERKNSVSMQVKICEDGKLYLLLPIPEGATMEEVNEVVASGELMLVDGMITERPINWEERDGELWYDSGVEGDSDGEPIDSWVKGIDENGLFAFFTTRFVKAE